MSKVLFDYAYLSQNVLPNINDALIELSAAFNSANISVPRDFYRANDIYNAQKTIKKSYNDLKAIRDWINKSETTFSNVQTNIINQTNRIEQVSIKPIDKLL